MDVLRVQRISSSCDQKVAVIVSNEFEFQIDMAVLLNF